MKCASPNALISLILPSMNFSLNSNPKFVQHCEERNLLVEDIEVKLDREEESDAPNVLPDPPKKKRRTKKADITSMERIDSYMSNTYLGKMRAAGQIQKAPISRTFFEKNKRKKKKKKKGAKTSAKSDSNLTQLKFLIGKKK